MELGNGPSAQASGAGHAAVKQEPASDAADPKQAAAAKQEPASDAAAPKDAAAAAAGRVLRRAAGRCRELLLLEFLRAELQVKDHMTSGSYCLLTLSVLDLKLSA